MLGNEPRHASGLRTSDPGQTTAGDLSPRKTKTIHLTLTCSCEACSAFTRVAARTLAPSPIRDLLHRRLQPFRHLHDCSGCFRLERFAGWDLHPLESAALSRRTPVPAHQNRSQRTGGMRQFLPFTKPASNCRVRHGIHHHPRRQDQQLLATLRARRRGPRNRKRAYVEWVRAVVSGLPFKPAVLMARFEEAARLAMESIKQ